MYTEVPAAAAEAVTVAAAASAREFGARADLEDELGAHIAQAAELRKAIASSERAMEELRARPIDQGGFKPPTGELRSALVAARQDDTQERLQTDAKRVTTESRHAAAAARRAAAQRVGKKPAGTARRSTKPAAGSTPPSGSRYRSRTGHTPRSSSSGTGADAAPRASSGIRSPHRSPVRPGLGRYGGVSSPGRQVHEAPSAAPVLVGYSDEVKELMTSMKAALALVQTLHKQLSDERHHSAAARLRFAQSGADACTSFYKDASKIHKLHARLGGELGGSDLPPEDREFGGLGHKLLDALQSDRHGLSR